MDPQQLFVVVSFLHVALPAMLGFFLMFLQWCGNRYLRGFVSIAVVWVLSVLFTIFVYNPSGIAVGEFLGMDSPEMKYDNNTIASSLLGGWIYPSIGVFLAAWLQRHSNSRNPTVGTADS